MITDLPIFPGQRSSEAPPQTAEVAADLDFSPDRPASEHAHAGTCGHDRPTAAARCAKVRPAMRPAVPLQSGWSGTLPGRIVERAFSTLRRPKTQDKCQSIRDRGSLVETAAVLAVLSAGDAVTRCPHRDGGELPDLPGAGPSARCTRRPTTSSGASGAGRPSRGWRPAAGPGRGGRGLRPRCLRVAGYGSLRPASPARSTMTSARLARASCQSVNGPGGARLGA